MKFFWAVLRSNGVQAFKRRDSRSATFMCWPTMCHVSHQCDRSISIL